MTKLYDLEPMIMDCWHMQDLYPVSWAALMEEV